MSTTAAETEKKRERRLQTNLRKATQARNQPSDDGGSSARSDPPGYGPAMAKLRTSVERFKSVAKAYIIN